AGRRSVRGDADDRTVRQHRPAGDERLHRRVPRAHRRLPHGAGACAHRHDRRHHLGRVSSRAHSADSLQSARQGGKRAHSGSQPSRAGDHDSARRGDRLAWRLSGPGASAHADGGCAFCDVPRCAARRSLARRRQRRVAMITNLDLTVPSQLTLALVPDLGLMGGGMLLLIWAALRPESDRHQRAVGMASIVLTGVTILLCLAWSSRYTAGTGPIALDNFRWLIDVVVLLGTVFAIAMSMDDNMRSGITAAESHVLILLASSGMMLLAAARDLMIVFLGVELMSISVYALAGMNRRSVRSAEGALKYFLLGAFSTAFLLYGIALVYGATGTTNLALIAGRTTMYSLASSPLLLIGIALLLIGFGFKVATVPFHMWAPDVYDGAPSPITAYMAATVKAAAFAAFIRVWLEALPFISGRVRPAAGAFA